MRMPLEDDGWQRVMKSIKLKMGKKMKNIGLREYNDV